MKQPKVKAVKPVRAWVIVKGNKIHVELLIGRKGDAKQFAKDFPEFGTAIEVLITSIQNKKK